MDQAEKTLKALQRGMLWNDPEKFEKHFGASPSDATKMAENGLAFASVVGSWNYDLQTDESDVDLKSAYWPQFRDFYSGRLPTVRILSPTLDLTMVPLHNLFQNIVKCNWGFVELLFPRKESYQFCYPIRDFSNLFEMASTLVRGNPRQVVAANLGSAAQAEQKARLYLSDKKEMKARKEQAKAYRFLFATEVYLMHGRLDGWRDSWVHNIHHTVMEGNISFEDMENKLLLTRNDVKEAEKRFGPDLDQTCTPGYMETAREYENLLLEMTSAYVRDI